jgi:hypothetical protein
MPLQATSGAASYDAFGGGVPVPVNYIEDVFSTYLYTGNAGTQTVTNGIDLSTKGGMVWTKSRSNSYAHSIMDTVRGFNYSGTQTRRLDPSTTDNEADSAGNATQATPLSDGFSITTSGGGAINFYNASGATYASWTFREQPNFFDIVTYTGNGSARTIAHNLGSVPGFIIIKDRTNNGSAWAIYHTSLGNTQFLQFTTSAAGTSSGYWNNTSPTSTQFTVGTNGNVNQSGANYIAYLFAHDAGGFGLTGTDNVISCGTYTGTGSPLDVTLGYEPQWLLVKKTSATGDWILMDTMRGMSMTTSQWLYPNAATIEDASGTQLNPTATGFTVTSTGSGLNGGGATYIYIAIRRGPMKVPTVGTSVFSPEVQTPGGGFFTAAANSGFPIDWLPTRQKGVVTDWYQTSRLTNNYMSPNTTATEAAYTYGFDLMQGVRAEWSTNTTVSYAFRRAPGFFDVVAYTGTGAGGRVLNHNLGVAPELMIFKSRASTSDNNWSIQCAFGPSGKVYNLNGTGNYNGTLATSLSASSITLSDNTTNNTVAYVAYLFATCPGVSKVGSYAGSASAVQVDCGFTTGARFVLIKYADGTGGWIVFDSARGIISGNDPYLEFNNTNAEITSEDYIDPYSAGFEISAAAPGVLNGINRTFIFLAIA